MQLLRQSTVATVYVGPVLDALGVAVTTAVTGDFRLVKNGTAATLSGATVTHDANGYYTIALTTGNTDTVGRLNVSVGNTSMSMATFGYSVLLPSVFDALITNAANTTNGLPLANGTGVNVTQWGGTAVASATVRSDLINIGGVAVSTSTAQLGVNVVNWGGTATGSALVRGNLIQIAGQAVTASGGITFPAATLASTTNITAATGVTLAGVTHTGAVIPTVTSVTNPVTAGTVSDKTGYSLTPTTGLGNQTANITGNLSGTVGSISGVTFPANFGALGINVSGHITRVTTVDTATAVTTVNGLANNVITTASIANGAYTNAKFATGAIRVAGDEFGNSLVLTAIAQASQIPVEFTSATFASTGVFATAALANAPSGSGPSAAAIADAVWDEAISGHLTAGSTGQALNAAGGAGDPWIVTLPGSYTGDQAGAILDAIRDKAMLITGTDMFIAVDRVVNGTIVMYKNESTPVTVPLAEDTTSKTLRFVVEDSYGNDILSIANASITRNSSSFTVTIPATVTDELANHTWALRDITGGINRLVRKGVLTVQAAADNDV